MFARVSGTDGINNELLQTAGASVASSTGGGLGNLTHQITASAFAGNSSQNGTVQDFDSDGDLDVGSPGTASAGKIVYRANSAQPVTNAIDANTAEVQLGTVTYTATGGFGATYIQVVPRGGTTSGVAQWNEDGIATAKTPGTGTFGGDRNAVMLIRRDGSAESWPAMAKAEVAGRLAAAIADALRGGPAGG